MSPLSLWSLLSSLSLMGVKFVGRGKLQVDMGEVEDRVSGGTISELAIVLPRRCGHHRLFSRSSLRATRSRATLLASTCGDDATRRGVGSGRLPMLGV